VKSTFEVTVSFGYKGVNMRIIGIVLLSLFIFVGHVSAMDISLDQSKMCNNIKESLRDNPEFWIVKSFELLYIPDAKKATEARESMFPGICEDIEMVLQFDVYNVGYVHIEEPFEMKFEDEPEEIMIKEVKKFLYRYLRDQVGDLVEKEEQNIPDENPAKEVIKEVGPDGMSKL